MHPDIFAISKRAKDMGFYVALSSNGTLITPDNITQIAEIGYQYIGVSLDGIGETHDKFRQKRAPLPHPWKGLNYVGTRALKPVSGLP